MNSSATLPPTDYERTDAPPRRVLWVGLGILGGIILCLALSFGLYARKENNRTDPAPRQTSFRQSPEARSSIDADWQRLEATVHARLHTYGWINRDAGEVHIPIDVAMQRLIDESTQPPQKP